MSTTLYDIVKNRILSQFVQRFSDDPAEISNVQKLFRDIYLELDNIYDILIFLKENRGLTNATGVALDYLGETVGIPRPYKQLDPDLSFTFNMAGQASDLNKGFFDGLRGGYFQSEEGLTEKDIGISTEKEDDDVYRKLIRARAIGNNAGGTVDDIYRFIFDGFDCEAGITSEDVGTVVVEVEDWLSKVERYYIKNKGPHAAGIELFIKNWEI